MKVLSLHFILHQRILLFRRKRKCRASSLVNRTSMASLDWGKINRSQVRTKLVPALRVNELHNTTDSHTGFGDNWKHPGRQTWDPPLFIVLYLIVAVQLKCQALIKNKVTNTFTSTNYNLIQCNFLSSAAPGGLAVSLSFLKYFTTRNTTSPSLILAERSGAMWGSHRLYWTLSAC